MHGFERAKRSSFHFIVILSGRKFVHKCYKSLFLGPKNENMDIYRLYLGSLGTLALEKPICVVVDRYEEVPTGIDTWKSVNN